MINRSSPKGTLYLGNFTLARYDRIGRSYDGTRRADNRIVERLHVLLALEGSRRVLDVGCGTGNYTIALAESGLMMTGVDLSTLMLEAARAKAPAIDWHLCDAADLPFADDTFDGAVCTVAIHHMHDRTAVFNEVCRVLTGGRFVIFTATEAEMRGYWLNHYFPNSLANSMAQMPPFEEIEETLRDAGFRDIKSEPFVASEDLMDLFLYSGKHRPGLYLDPAIRAGISTFAAFADEAEVPRGLAALEADIESGAIEAVMARYAHGGGDYLFVSARA